MRTISTNPTLPNHFSADLAMFGCAIVETNLMGIALVVPMRMLGVPRSRLENRDTINRGNTAMAIAVNLASFLVVLGMIVWARIQGG